MTMLRVTALAAVLMASGYAYGQDKKESGTPRVQKYQEIERGFWVRSYFGLSAAMTDMFSDQNRKSLTWPREGQRKWCGESPS